MFEFSCSKCWHSLAMLGSLNFTLPACAAQATCMDGAGPWAMDLVLVYAWTYVPCACLCGFVNFYVVL